MPRARGGGGDVSLERSKRTDGRFAGLFTSVGTTDSVVRWGDVDGSAIVDVLKLFADEGAALMFSRASDGGAICLTVFDGDDRRRFWFRQPADVEDWASEMREKARKAGFGGP